MAVFKDVLNPNFIFPNITIYDILRDEVLTGYRARPNEGYVMYSQSTDVIVLPEINHETGEPIIETYYCRQAQFPLNFNFDNFDYIAVLESEVPADHIFGGGGNDHEVI